MDPSVFKLWPDTLILQVFVCFCCYLIMENGRQRIPLGSLSSSSARSGRKRISLAALSPSSARTDFGNSIPDTVRVCQCIREAGLPAKFLLLRLPLDEALL
ncbi:uncharacterized protein LOC108218256 isoform X7 [Daucus carota subsp. sativus]|uniref:uncharacterized protein LOC108218256 isoform X7 n=1 Tax=Daucus carota subsp. sativus TaxID=79200 RepID=UPI0030836DBA